MDKIGIIRCEKNQDRCPLTSGLDCLRDGTQGFSGYETGRLVGVFGCRCPGDIAVDLAKILQAKGATIIHFPTCTVAHKSEGQWILGDGFCDHLEDLAGRIAEEVGIPCVIGTAHLPAGYTPQVFEDSAP